MERKDTVLNNGVTMPPIGYGVFRMTDLGVSAIGDLDAWE